MTAPTCERTWQAEAVEDGRLVGPDRASFERHAGVCPACAAEVAAFGALRQRMGEVVASVPTDLEQRRARLDLLRSAHVRRKSEQPVVRRAWLVACVLGVACAGVWSVRGRAWPWHSTPAPGASSVASPAFDVVDVAGAEVSSRNEGDITRAVLSDGIASFHVERVLPGQRFLVTLPDGEIEVRGTRFVVGVREGRTERVDVTEGIVVLRLRGQDDLRLAAGDQWAAPRVTTPNPVKPQAAAELPSSSASATSARSPTPFRTPDTAPPEACAAANDCFGAAMAVFDDGFYGKADALFASFIRNFPRDARAEDASFLRAVAHSRLGDRAGAASLAGAYVIAFPGGLRRKEAEALVRNGASP